MSMFGMIHVGWVAFALAVLANPVQAFGAKPLPAVPRFRQEIAKVAERRLNDKIPESFIAGLAQGRVALTADCSDEMTRANKKFEGMALQNRLDGIVALTNSVRTFHMGIERLRADAFGYGELFKLVDVAWGGITNVSMPNDLIEATDVFARTRLCTVFLIASCTYMGYERQNPDVFRAEAKKVKEEVEASILPSCRKHGAEKKSAEAYRKALEIYQEGVRGVEAGFWEEGLEIMRQAREMLQEIQYAAMDDD